MNDNPNFKNYEKCAAIVNDPRFIFKSDYDYPQLYPGDGVKDIFYHCCKHEYIDEMKILIMHKDGGAHISDIQDKLNHPEKYGYDNYDIVDKSKFIKEMCEMLVSELDTDDMDYTLSLSTLKFALYEYGYKQRNLGVITLLQSKEISLDEGTPFGCTRRLSNPDDKIIQLYSEISLISKNGGSRAITMDVLRPNL